MCHFVPFHLVIVFSVRLRFTSFDYPFGIFKLFFGLHLKLIYFHVILGYSRVLMENDTMSDDLYLPLKNELPSRLESF
jgi:hypothetical protein